MASGSTFFALIIMSLWRWIGPILCVILFFLLMKSFFTEVFNEVVQLFS